MKAIITTWERNDRSEFTKELKKFEEFKDYVFTPNMSITLFADRLEKGYLHLNAFPDRTSQISLNYEYAVTLFAEKIHTKLLPPDIEPDSVDTDNNIYVAKELMLEAVEYYFRKYTFNPLLRWKEYIPHVLTTGEREDIDKQLQEMFDKYGDPFNGTMH